MAEISVIRGDCIEQMRLMEEESVDCILTDPPYGISFQSAWRTETERFDKIQNDGKPFVWWLMDAFRILKDGGRLVCFCRWDVQEAFKQAIEWAGFTIKGQIVWDREIHGLGDLKAQFAPQHDVAWYATKGRYEFKNGRPKSLLRYQRVTPEKAVHPTEKPVPLMRYLAEKLTSDGEVVLDPFLGGGSTAIACQQINRDCIGIELSEEYAEKSRRRLAQKSLLTV